jgi:hypothetical protein
MSFEHILANADPEDAAEEANIIARALVNDPSASDAARAAAATILELSTEELTQRLRPAREEAAPANHDADAALSLQTKAKPSST